MKIIVNTCKIVLLALCAGIVSAAPVLQVAKSSQVSLLKNGDFEQGSADQFANWNRAPKGYQIDLGDGRNHSRALVAENGSGQGWFGASQTVLLNRVATAPLRIEGWSKALNVTGGSDSGYSLYVDLLYQDNSQLWGQTANFQAGTHDWQLRGITIFPEKPVKSLNLHCLFRGHAGKVWFDDLHVAEMAGGRELSYFQGAAVKPADLPPGSARGNETPVASDDGLHIQIGPGALPASPAGPRDPEAPVQGRFLARDAAADSGFFDFTGSNCDELGLKMRAEITGHSNYVAVEGRVTDITDHDRAITLVFALELDAQGWQWGDDIRRSRTISDVGEFAKQVSVNCGATGTESLYPIAPIWQGDTGLALGLDMARPAVFRMGYHAGLKRLFIAYDFALVKDTEHFPSGADFRFVIYRFTGPGGFRAAWEKFMGIFPEHFEVRSREQGLWMPFTDVSKVVDWPDFGFRYHEGANAILWDDEHGILSFRYTEPMTWWMPMAPDLARTLPEAIRVRDGLTDGPDRPRRKMAQVTQAAAMHDESGEPALLFRNTPWANGAVWSLNPNPLLESTRASGITAETLATNAAAALPLNAATVYWNDTIKERLYGARARGQLDGEYLDSLEGYVTAELNFRREHFRSTTVPLTFSTETKQPVLFKGLAVFEFTRWLAQDVHRLGKLMFANGVPYRFSYLCPWLDVLGTETDWLTNGRYHPVSLETTDLWRTLSGAKPYLLLMNTDYDLFTPDLVEKYFQRALFYGMWPGFFSHNAADNPYWQNPRWYERDRPLFKKYIPLIRRVAEGGWHPATYASCGNTNILVERFGSAPQGSTYFTLFNHASTGQTGTVTVDPGAPGSRTAPKSLLGPSPEPEGRGWRIALQSEETALWEFAE